MRTTPATAFVVALAAFVSDASPALAGGEFHPCLEDWTSSECIDINNVRDLDQSGNDKEAMGSDDATPATVTQSEDEPGGMQ